jgi:hypothetical protein
MPFDDFNPAVTQRVLRSLLNGRSRRANVSVQPGLQGALTVLGASEATDVITSESLQILCEPRCREQIPHLRVRAVRDAAPRN